MKPQKLTPADWLRFEAEKGLLLPEELKAHFLPGNGADDECRDNLFCFYSFSHFYNVDVKLGRWRGIPDYGNIINTLPNSRDCFVFADYMFHLHAYAIRLYKEPAERNEVYVICGDEYKEIAGSFTEFMALYAADADELYL